MRPFSSPQRRRRGSVAVAAVLAMGLLTGCQEVPVISVQDPLGDFSAGSPREWVENEVDAVIKVTGLRTQWRMVLELDRRWHQDREMIFERSYRPPCKILKGELSPRSVRIDLITDPLEGNALELAEQVRAHWESEGWEISQIGPNYYRADRPDGARLAIEGTHVEDRRMLVLAVQSACSYGI